MEERSENTERKIIDKVLKKKDQIRLNFVELLTIKM